MKQIKLTKGYFAIVDDEDFEYLNKWKWHTLNGYAARGIRVKEKKITIYMHTVIMNTPKGKQIDHINRNRCDNRKNNLRIASNLENSYNKEKIKNTTCDFKGVRFHKRDKKWYARISANKKEIHLGIFINPELAAKAYDKAAIKHHGEFAILNFKKSL